MKLRNKVFAGFAATILALSMMVGTALAADKLPAAFDTAAGGTVVDGQTSQNDVWVKIIGGGSLLYGDADIAHATRTVDVTVTGKATYDLEFIYNFDGGWGPAITKPGESVDGEVVYNFPMNGAGTTWCEAIVNLKNKSEGALEITKMDFKDEAGAVLLTIGGAAEAEVPQTGVVSAALFLALGTAVFGSGAVVLKKKER